MTDRRSAVTDKAQDVLASLSWCLEQAEGIMANTAGAATTHGDPSGALEMCNSMASDIAINLQQSLASLSASPDKPRERLARKVGVAIANRANLGDEPPVGASASPEQNTSCSGEMTLAFEQAGWLAVAQIAEDRGDHAVAEEARQNAKRLTALRNRDDVLEEAAKVAEVGKMAPNNGPSDTPVKATRRGIAQAIRGLKNG